MKDDNEWVVLATFSWKSEALVLKGLLESAGISVRIPEEHMSTINPLVTAMSVHVMVRSAELEQAKEFLNATEEQGAEHPADSASLEDTCPSCGGHDFIKRGGRIKNGLLFLFAALFFMPMRKSEKLVCKSCGRIL